MKKQKQQHDWFFINMMMFSVIPASLLAMAGRSYFENSDIIMLSLWLMFAIPLTIRYLYVRKKMGQE